MLLLKPFFFITFFCVSSLQAFAQCASCTYTISSSGTYSQTVNSGETLCITGNTTINSDSYIGLKNGANLTMCNSGTDTIRMNINPSTGGGSPGPITIRNYANMVYGQNTNMDSRTSVYNYKYMKVQGDLNASASLLYNADTAGIIVTGYINTGGTITNDGTMEVGSYAQVGSQWNQNGTLRIGDYMNLSNGSDLRASGTSFIGGNMSLTRPVTSTGGTFHVGGVLSVNSGGSFDLTSSTFYTKDLEIYNGPISSTGCSVFIASDYTTVNSGISFSGQVHIVDSTTTGSDSLDLNYCTSCAFTAGPDNPCNTVLPIELMYFAGIKENAFTRLIWSTATEHDNDFFTVERSIDGKTFVQIGTIEGAGFSSGKLDYNYLDNEVKPGLAYYRLKQTDFDGTFSYSPVISVSRDGLNLTSFYSQQDASFGILIHSGKDEDVRLRIIDVEGRVRFNELIRVTKGANKIPVSKANFSPGNYFVQLQQEMDIMSVLMNFLIAD